jgi:hypothetical protein
MAHALGTRRVFISAEEELELVEAVRRLRREGLSPFYQVHLSDLSMGVYTTG